MRPAEGRHRNAIGPNDKGARDQAFAARPDDHAPRRRRRPRPPHTADPAGRRPRSTRAAVWAASPPMQPTPSPRAGRSGMNTGQRPASGQTRPARSSPPTFPPNAPRPHTSCGSPPSAASPPRREKPLPDILGLVILVPALDGRRDRRTRRAEAPSAGADLRHRPEATGPPPAFRPPAQARSRAPRAPPGKAPRRAACPFTLTEISRGEWARHGPRGAEPLHRRRRAAAVRGRHNGRETPRPPAGAEPRTQGAPPPRRPGSGRRSLHPGRGKALRWSGYTASPCGLPHRHRVYRQAAPEPKVRKPKRASKTGGERHAIDPCIAAAWRPRKRRRPPARPRPEPTDPAQPGRYPPQAGPVA